MKPSKAVTWIFLLSLFAAGCGEKTYYPKPRAFPRILYPDRAYQAFQSPQCPFTFSFPTYAQIEFDTQEYEGKPENACWFDVLYKPFDARLHCSYYTIGGESSLSKLMEDAFVMADKINQRSNYMDEIVVRNPYGTGGLLMEFTGRAASPMQFFLTDSTTHFLKASLYFNARVNPDSIGPIAEFVKEDVAHLINTLQWQ
jgi:gliding motility-associated lipoprotein GldD